jgi:hypothetical protein
MTMLLGIDLGTTLVKSAIIDAEKAQIISTASREIAIAHPPPGWAEQSPDDWWCTVAGWAYVLVWGGLRSAVGMALALSLPASLESQEILSHQFAHRMREHFHKHTHHHWEHVRLLLRDNIDFAYTNRRHAERDIANQQKNALLRLMRIGIISDDVYSDLVREVDRQLVDGLLMPDPVLARGLDIPLPEQKEDSRDG